MHHYVSRNHSEYFFKSKKELDFDLVSSFSEKFSFPIKDAIQGFYWSNDHATVLPFLTYLKMFDGEKVSVSIVIISDHLSHDTVLVHAFLKPPLQYLQYKSVIENKLMFYRRIRCAI